MKSVHSLLLETIKKYIDKHISILTTSLNNKNKTKRFKVTKGTTSVTTGTPFITNESLITFDRIVGNPATSIANIGVDGDYFVDSGVIHFKEFNKDIVISCGVNYGTHDIAHADILGQKTTENDISVMKHEIDMLSGSGIGFEGIYYIQDVGSKVKGKIYLDKTQEGVWKCLNTTTSINNTSDFERIDATTLDDKLRNLCNLKIIYTDNIMRVSESDILYIIESISENGIEFTNNSTAVVSIPLNLPKAIEYSGAIGSTPSKGGAYGKHNISVFVHGNGIKFYNGDWSSSSSGKNYSTRFTIVVPKYR